MSSVALRSGSSIGPFRFVVVAFAVTVWTGIGIEVAVLAGVVDVAG